MDPSSLIFLAIIAIWAAYLLGHWVRRRDQIATARSIDRFSEAMRVLERRTPTRPVSAARPTARAYVVAPVRVPAPAPARRQAGDARPAASSPAASGTSPRVTAAAARRRARLVLGLVVVTALAWVLVGATALVWWPAAVVTALLAAVLVQLRRTARRTARRAGRPDARSRRRGLASRVPAPARRPRHHQDARSVLEQVNAARRSHAEAALSTSAVVATALAGSDVAESDVGPGLTHTASAGPGVEPQPSDGGWQPVPVPPPTYTLKPKARPVRRPLVDAAPAPLDAAGPVVEGQAAGSPVSVSSPRPDVQPSAARAPEPPAFDLDEILERRIASGS